MQTKCFVCGREGFYYSEYLKQNLCKKHFEKMLIKRIKSGVITNGCSAKNYKLMHDDSIGFKINSFLFKEDKNARTTLDNGTLEDFALEVFKYFLSAKTNIKVADKGRFNPLYTTSEPEIIGFFGLKGKILSPAKRSTEDNALLEMLKDIEKRRPGGMVSLVKIGRRLGVI